MSITKTTIVVYQYSGDTNELTIPFDYLKRDFVIVSLGGDGKPQKALKLGTDYRFATKTTIVITRQYQPNEGYNKVIVRRVTEASKRIINYQDGSILNASELNTSQLQALHVAEEARDLANYTIFVDDNNNLDARGRVIINLGDPINPQDAVTKKYVDTASESVIDSRDKALQYRNEAEEFKNQAKGFRNEAEGFRNEADRKATEISSKITEANELNTQANVNSNKAQQYATSSQQSASAASIAEKNAKASDKNAAISAENSKHWASQVQPENLVHTTQIVQEKGDDITKILSQAALTKLLGSVINADKVSDMNQLNLKIGDVVHLLGYSDKNDGAMHYRIIQEEEDESSIMLSNGLKANILPISYKVNIMSFGCKPDGITDNFALLSKCASFCKSKGLQMFSSGGNYVVKDGNLELRGISLSCNSDFVLGDSNYLVLGGNSISGHNATQFIRAVRTSRKSPETTPVVKIIGAKGQYTRIEYASSVLLYASSSMNRQSDSIAYSTFDLDYVPYLTLDSEGSGWINENTFNLKRCFRFTIKGEYTHNNNVINGGTFEGVGDHIVIEKGSDNVFNSIRLEGYKPDAIKLGAETTRNKIELSWVSSDSSELVFSGVYQDLGTSNIITSNTDGSYTYNPIICLNRETLIFNKDSKADWCSLKNVGDFKAIDDDAPSVKGVLSVQPQGKEELVASSWAFICRTIKIPVTPASSWIIINGNGFSDGCGYRIALYGYDKDGVKIPSGSKDVTFIGHGDYGFGSIGVGANSINAEIKILNNKCFYVKVVIRNGNNDSAFKNLDILVRNSKNFRKANGESYRPRCIPFNIPNVYIPPEPAPANEDV